MAKRTKKKCSPKSGYENGLIEKCLISNKPIFIGGLQNTETQQTVKSLEKKILEKELNLKVIQDRKFGYQLVRKEN